MRALRTAVVALAALAATVPPAAAANPEAQHGRCVVLRSDGGAVARAGSGWRIAPAGEPLRLQATALGRYLLLARDGTFLTAGDGAATAPAEPTHDGDWRFTDAGGAAVRLATGGRALTSRSDGTLGTGDGTAFVLDPADACATFPEAEVNVRGEPHRGATTFGETTGLIETHLHGMAFEFLGGSVHCGRPWHPLGITKALVDCPDHGPNGQSALAENFLAHGNPAQGHSTDGWPSFRGWPTHRTYTHEQTYYKWLERARRAGLRLYTNLLVDNEVLCEVYPLKRNSCNEMDGVRLQRRRLDQLVDYIDAQHGGRGKGWLRIVRDPFEARRVINEGKLALVVGIEVSKLFDCGEVNRVPQCSKADIDRQLAEVHAMGVRQMELVNKTDNALVGVAGDAGTFGILTNTANKYDTGHFWSMQTCEGPTAEHDHDKPQVTTAPGTERDELPGAIIATFLPPDATPFYPPAPHCNAQGLTDLGAYLIRRMIDRKMLFDPDHMSVLGRDQALSIIEAERYGGVLSSHSWSTPDAYRRILAAGGVVTPAPKTVERFLESWKELKAGRNARFLYGTGWSTDMNGFASQGGPRPGNEANPVRYPFRSLDGSVLVDRQRTGTRTFDLNVDGTAHFGLYPDVLEDLRIVGGPEVAQDLLRGAEAYLQMWERAEGVRAPTCRAAQRRFIAQGLGEIRLGMEPERLLRSAGQPSTRPGRRWTWCAGGTRGGEVVAVLTRAGRVELVGSTAPLHRFRGIGRGSRAGRLAGRARRVGPGLRVRTAGRRTAVVHGVRRGRVTFTAVVPRRTAASPRRLRAALRAARLR